MYKAWIGDSPPSRRRGGRRRRRNRRPDAERGGSPVKFQKKATLYCSGRGEDDQARLKYASVLK
jgi:hypothetical protein